MKSVAAALILLALSSFAQTDSRVVAIKRGVVKVQAQPQRGAEPNNGSAIFIGTLNRQTFFLTACHVVEKTKWVKIQTFDNRADWIDVSVYDSRCDRQNDIAVLVAPSYLVPRRSVEMIVQSEPSTLRPGDRLLVLGHSLNQEWLLREAKVQSLTPDLILIEPGVLTKGDSGGAILDTTGKLVGVSQGRTWQGSDKGTRLDTALAVLAGWRVPYKTRLPVNFCDMVTHLVDWSKNEFSDLKGPEIELRHPEDAWGYFREGPEWALREKSMDITGEGRSRLISYRGNTVYYIARFGEQSEKEEAEKIQNSLAERIRQCLPKSSPVKTEGHCLSVWTPYKRMNWNPPASFDVYVGPNSNDVELFAYRSATQPIDCKSKQ